MARLLALLAAVALAAPAAAQARAVTVQGDSLTVAALPYLAVELGGDRMVSRSAQVGRHVDEGLRLLRAQRLGAVVVFALGTNDYTAATAWFAARLRLALRIAGPDRCLVVPTVYAHGPARAINAVLARAGARLGGARLQVPDWAAAVAAGRVRLADGVHPASAAGARLLARMTAAAVRRCAA
jgi:hypothetical protein